MAAKSDDTMIWVGGALAVGGLAYYFLVYKPAQVANQVPAPGGTSATLTIAAQSGQPPAQSGQPQVAGYMDPHHQPRPGYASAHHAAGMAPGSGIGQITGWGSNIVGAPMASAAATYPWTHGKVAHRWQNFGQGEMPVSSDPWNKSRLPFARRTGTGRA